jgi:hypothetical protein
VDFIEKLFHISPDGGNGTLEVLIYLIVFTVLALPASALVRAIRRGRSR